MIDIYMKNDILSLYRKGTPIKQIERKLGVSRNTVRSYVREYDRIMDQINNTTDKEEMIRLQNLLVSAPKRKSKRNRVKFTGSLEQRFIEIMESEDEKDELLKTNKQNLSAALVHRTLRAEGFDIGISTIQNEFKIYKNKNKEAFIKQCYPPGLRAEYDFHLVKAIIDGKKRNIYQATISLPYSNYKFTSYYENQNFESFIDSLISFFEHIGGVPAAIVFDNMRNVVRKFIYGGGKKYNKELIKIALYYGFEIQTTNPRKGNEKGHVETSGQHVRQNLFALNYKFNSLKHLREYSINELTKLNKDTLTKFNEEKLNLLPLLKDRYELGRQTTSKVNKESLISIDGNYYSVPDKYVSKTVNTVVYIDLIKVINDKHEIIATHNKKVGKGEYSINIFHFTTTFMKKPGALLNSLALKQAPKVIQTLFHKYFNTKPKEFINIISNNNIYELREILRHLDLGHSIHSINLEESIEDVSVNQLNLIADLFNQGDKTQ